MNIIFEWLKLYGILVAGLCILSVLAICFFIQHKTFLENQKRINSPEYKEEFKNIINGFIGITTLYDYNKFDDSLTKLIDKSLTQEMKDDYIKRSTESFETAWKQLEDKEEDLKFYSEMLMPNPFQDNTETKTSNKISKQNHQRKNKFIIEKRRPKYNQRYYHRMSYYYNQRCINSVLE